MTNTAAITKPSPKFPCEGDRMIWASPRGTIVEVQRTRFTYVVTKNQKNLGTFTTETEARKLAKDVSTLILRADRATMEANREAIATATPYAPKPSAPETPEAPSASSLKEISSQLGGNEMNKSANVARGSLTTISSSQREALINAVKYCGGKVRRGGKLHYGQITSIALTLTQLYALEKRGYIVLIIKNFEVLGGLVTDSARRTLGLV
jgi:hypothetical protein